jgi:hypothetical protein
MKYIFICSLLISVCINAMNESDASTVIYVKTFDDYIVAIDETLAQESNLITTLHEKYVGSESDPIPVPVTYKELTFFCDSIVQPAEQLI